MKKLLLLTVIIFASCGESLMERDLRLFHEKNKREQDSIHALIEKNNKKIDVLEKELHYK